MALLDLVRMLVLNFLPVITITVSRFETALFLFKLYHAEFGTWMLFYILFGPILMKSDEKYIPRILVKPNSKANV